MYRLGNGSVQTLHSIFVIFCVYILSACGGGDGGPAPIGGGFAVGQVQALQFDSNGQAVVNFTELSGTEEFAFIMLAANVNEGSFGVQLKSGATSSLPQDKLLATPSEILKQVDLGEDPTSTLHEILREEEFILGQVLGDYPQTGVKLLAGSQSNNISGGGLAGSSFAPNYFVGSGLQVKILNSLTSTSSFDTVHTTVRRITANATYVVENVAAGNLPDSVLNPLIDEFEAKIPIMKNILGNESDVNNDGTFTVCFCAGVNRLGQTAGGFITGFFFGGDLFSASSIPSSNEREIFYVAVPDPSGAWGVPLSTGFYQSNIGPTVLPHEYQHMINFNQKALLRNAGADDPWENEGKSHLMEDLSIHTHLSQVGNENPSRARIYLSAPESAAFTGGTSLAQRGGSYLFFRYLYEQADHGRYTGVFSGDDLLTQLLQSNLKGVSNIESITGFEFRELLVDFFATLQLSNKGITDNPRYNFSGINLHSEQNDNRGTILEGVNFEELPSISISTSINSPGGVFFNADGQIIESQGKAINFSAGQGMIPGGAVVRLR